MSMKLTRRTVLAMATATAFAPRAYAQGGGSDVLVYATGTDGETLDPIAITDRPPARISMHIHETLVIQKDGEFHPLLASEWTQSDDGLTWTFLLRQGVTFHDGTPFDAEAVKWNFDRFLNPDVHSPRRSLGAVIDTITVVDSHTIAFRTKEPFAPFLSVVSSYNLGLVSPTNAEAQGDALPRNPVGTGPFRMVQWNKNNSVLLERYDDYWGEKAKTRQIRIVIVPEDSARLLQLMAGEVDVIANVPIPLVSQLSAHPEVELIEQDSIRTIYLGLNMTRAPFDNPLVRQALAHAIDIEAITSTLLRGFATLATSMEAPGLYGAATDLPRWTYNPERARELLAQAGVSAPIKADFFTPTGRYNGDRQVAEAIQAQAAAAGFELQIHAPEYGAFLEAARGKQADIFLSGKGTTTGDVDSTMRLVVKTGGTVNYFGYSDPEVDAMIDAQAYELDTEKRLEQLHEIQRRFHEACATVPLYYERQIFARRKNVEGLHLGRDEHIDFVQAVKA